MINHMARRGQSEMRILGYVLCVPPYSIPSFAGGDVGVVLKFRVSLADHRPMGHALDEFLIDSTDMNGRWLDTWN